MASSVATETVGFLLLPKFSLGAFAASVEPLRLANRVAGQTLYSWACFSSDGETPTASCGLAVPVDGGPEAAEQVDTLILVGGEDITRFSDTELCRWLRRMDRKGLSLGAVCTASWVLARAGLLENRVATIHWENLDALAETFPKVRAVPDLFAVEAKHFTSAGGFAAADMMLSRIAMRQGQEIAVRIAEQLIHERIRGEGDSQHLAVSQRLGARHPKLLQVVQRMEENLESPLPRDALVRDLGLSTRQMERLFRRYLNKTPARYYLDLRLERARHLLLQTQMSVLQIALACGFVSASHFSRCYRDRFRHTPRNERGLPDPEAAPAPAKKETHPRPGAIADART